MIQIQMDTQTKHPDRTWQDKNEGFSHSRSSTEFEGADSKSSRHRIAVMETECSHSCYLNTGGGRGVLNAGAKPKAV